MAFNYQESGSQSESTSQSGTLPWYNTLVQNLLNRGQTASQQPWGVYSGNRVAGFTPDQQAAFSNLRGQIGDWSPLLNQATGATGQAMNALRGVQSGPYAQGALNALGRATQQAQFDPAQQQRFMNPYVSNVVNEIGRLGQQNLQQNIDAFGNQFSDAGQFGSARQMAAVADAMARSQREISGAQGNALYQAQQAAGQQYGDWANRGIGAQQAMAQGQLGAGNFLAGLAGQQAGLGQQYAGLAGQQQQLGLADVNAQLGIGQQQQALSQAQIAANMQKFQEQQQAPWMPLTNYAQLLSGTPTPQQSTSTSTSTSTGWNTNFKKGGHVRKADGGMVDITALLDEIYPEEVPSGIGGLSQLAADTAMDRRRLGRAALQAPHLQPLPEPSTIGSLGEAMLRASAQGPANWGQLIGRSGAAYFDAEKSRRDTNAEREMARLKMADLVMPEVGRMGLGGIGTGEKLTQARGRDGSLWQLSNTDRSFARLVQPGNYASDIMKQATVAADKDLEGAIGLSTDQMRMERDRLIRHYADKLSREYAGLGAVPTAEVSVPLGRYEPGTPVPTGAAPNGGGGASMPRGDFDTSAGVDAVRAQIGRVADPTEREAALAAFERQLREGRQTPLQIPTPEERHESEAVGKGMGQRFMEIQKAGEESESRLNMLTRMADLLVGVQTGKLTPVGTEIAGWAQAANESFGGLVGYKPFEIDANLGNKEAMNALSRQFALQLRSPAGGAGMPGALSDSDRKFLESMSPSLAQTPKGVQRMLETYQRLEQRSKEVAQLAREYRERNPRKTFDAGFFEELRKYADANPLFTDNTLEPTEPRGKSLRRGDVVGDYQYIGPEPATREHRRNANNWRQVQ